MVVVFICTLFLLLPTLTIKKSQQVLEVKHFFSSFEKNILFTQQMAVVEMVDTQVLFFEQNQQIQFWLSKSESSTGKHILKVPESLKATGPDKIIFKNSSGNNGKLAKFSFLWTEKKQVIEFQFQLGSGRYVKKIKQV
ncbi:prepilin-type N-terminal cleavage/methylation domain-containing protein [Enterococcus caccae]|nr:prepilin-type N-terminal cleavage/methylation domain-containing protein [Enterococcus caccae]